MKPGEYQCEHCGGIFKKIVSDDEVHAEHIKAFGCEATDPATVCDDCYKKIMTWFNGLPEAQKWRLRGK